MEYSYSKCDDEIVYIEVNQKTYPAKEAFRFIEGSADIKDPTIEKLCISHKMKRISLMFETYSSGTCGAISWMDGARREKYAECNSNFFSFDGGGTVGTNLAGCLILLCLPSLGGIHDVEFKSNHFTTAVKHLDLINYKSFTALFIKLTNRLDDLKNEFVTLMGKSYNYYSYDLEDYVGDFRSYSYDLKKTIDQIDEIKPLSKKYAKSFKKYEKEFQQIQKDLEDLNLKLTTLDDKEIRFASLDKTGKADAAERIRKEKEQKKLIEAKNALVIASKKILFNLGYEIDNIDAKLNLKARTAIVAFQKDYRLTPIVNEPNEQLLVELQRAFRNSPNPIDLSNYELIGSGSGFLVDNDGHVVTNFHVVDECSLVTVGKRIPANIVKADRVNDVAILNINNIDNILPLSIAKNDIQLGEEVFVAGFPMNMIIENLNFTSGSISSEVGFGQNINQFQFTAPIQPGNSGGPIFNSYGGVVGIAVSSASTKELEELLGSNIQNINYGIKASTFKSLLNQTEVLFKEGNANWFSNQKNVASTAKTGTVLVQCWEG